VVSQRGFMFSELPLTDETSDVGGGLHGPYWGLFRWLFADLPLSARDRFSNNDLKEGESKACPLIDLALTIRRSPRESPKQTKGQPQKHDDH
jgi:hypothetical protein